MLNMLNEYVQQYEYLIKIGGVFLPFVTTVFMIYIAYQQWLINKSLEAYQVRQKRYENFDVPLKNIGKKIIETFTIEDKNLDKKEIYKKHIDEIFAIFENNYYIFEPGDYNLLNEAFNMLKIQFDKLKPMEKSSFKEIWESTKIFFNCFSIILALIFPYFTSASKSLNLYDLIKILILGIIKFITPHWIRRKFKRWFLPKWFLFVIVFGILFSFLNPFNILKKKSKKIKQKNNEKQLERFEQVEAT